jgi:hypothetical protein
VPILAIVACSKSEKIDGRYMGIDKNGNRSFLVTSHEISDHFEGVSVTVDSNGLLKCFTIVREDTNDISLFRNNSIVRRIIKKQGDKKFMMKRYIQRVPIFSEGVVDSTAKSYGEYRQYDTCSGLIQDRVWFKNGVEDSAYNYASNGDYYIRRKRILMYVKKNGKWVKPDSLKK